MSSYFNLENFLSQTANLIITYDLNICVLQYTVILVCRTQITRSLDMLWQAHEQLRAVLLTLLEDLPSDLPILLLGTSSVPLAEVDSEAASIFSHHSV